MDYNSQNNGYPPAQPDAPASIISVKEWMLTLLLLAIPIVNLVMLFVWAFGGGTHPTKANYAKAGLLWAAIVIVIYLVIFLVFGAALFAGMGNMERSGY
ncbi:hypothetical protein PTI45_01481 [Paenibacillus nuruki]|uniref:Uncharacterized protein n=1 Tax=Paenibacillus nuruki TaxID=1886670 RepID=A0A1E3L575_9BACL|nr:hypothetical protein PTI45_01481 [Paenibacillus nuruki]